MRKRWMKIIKTMVVMSVLWWMVMMETQEKEGKNRKMTTTARGWMKGCMAVEPLNPCGVAQKSCLMGSTCNEKEGKCDCDNAFPGFAGVDCGDMDCKISKEFHKNERDHDIDKGKIEQLQHDYTYGKCVCPEGWTGAACKICTSDNACEERYGQLDPTTNTTYKCNQTIVNYYNKVFDCGYEDKSLLAKVGPLSIVAECDGMTINGTEGKCLVTVNAIGGYPYEPEVEMDENVEEEKLKELLKQLRPKPFQPIALDNYPGGRQLKRSIQRIKAKESYPKGYVLPYFYCALDKCKQEFYHKGDDVYIKYKCEDASCDVSYRYPDISETMVDIIRSGVGPGVYDCAYDTSLCKIDIGVFEFFNVNCSKSGECVSHTFTYEFHKSYLAEIISGGVLLGITVVTVSFTLLYFIYSKIRDYRILQLWKQLNEHGANEFSFENITYSLKLWENGSFIRKNIIENISGKVGRGKLLALMGSSGAGKTTLLDILSGRRKTGYASGELKINGDYVTSDYKRNIGYVTQDINLMGTMTVSEAIMFSANLRLPVLLSKKEKKKRVKEAMEALGIAHLRNRRIGTKLKRGISGGEKRRVNIAVELVISPQVLFLDEPTTGLDSYNALKVVECLKQLAEKGRIIIMSIHQPRTQVFNLCDELLLLSEGKVVFSGPIPDVLDHFADIGYEVPISTNPADFILDIVNNAAKTQKDNATKPAHERIPSRNQLSFLIQKFQDRLLSPAYNTLVNENESNPAEQRALLDNPEPQTVATKKKRSLFGRSSSVNTAMRGATYSTSFYSQFYYLSWRAFKNFIRNWLLLPLQIGVCVGMGLILGISLWQTPLVFPFGIQNILGSFFFTCSLLGFLCMTSLELFIAERAIYISERANCYYNSWAYYFSKIIFDLIPLRVIPPVIFGSITYWMMGLRYDGDITYFLTYIGVIVLFNILMGGICLVIATMSTSVAMANMISIILMFYFMLFSGYLSNSTHLPEYLVWNKYLSPFSYTLEILFSEQLLNKFVHIKLTTIKNFDKTILGNIILLELGFNFHQLSFDMVILVVLSFAFLLIPGFLLHWFVYERR